MLGEPGRGPQSGRPGPYTHARGKGPALSDQRLQTDLDEIVNGALFEVKYDGMVIVKDIEFFSMCEHHMLPFYGKAHVAYLPSEKVIGLSKIPRIVDMFARRLQVQERLTQEIAETIQRGAETAGRRRHHRGTAFLHDDARRRKAALRHGDQRHAGRLPGAEIDTGRIPLARATAASSGLLISCALLR